MPDDLLIALDAALARTRASGAADSPRVDTSPSDDLPEDQDATEHLEEHAEPPASWGWVEIYLVALFGASALLFLPGAQAIRLPIRGLPYVLSLVLLVLFARIRGRGTPWSAPLLIGALGVIALNMLHPTSNGLAGIAQLIFQASIAAPLFWIGKAVVSPRHVVRLLALVFLVNLASAGVGVLQVYYPERFMPAQFSGAIEANEYYLASLSYRGRDGRIIMRPPGLTDMPGGAAIAGGLVALIGMGLFSKAGNTALRVFITASVAVGLAAVYFTQVRSILVMAIGGILVVAMAAFRRGRVMVAGGIALVSAAIVATSFLWASSVGGEAIDNRFLNIANQGVLRTYQDNRGGFLTMTAGELLDQYPLGAGVGRWGMMETYFGDRANSRTKPIHVEIQITGWLLDGGIPLCLFYGGAILLALLWAIRLTGARDPVVADIATLMLPIQLYVAGLSFSGPAFNMQMGMLFWVATAALHSVYLQRRPAPPIKLGSMSNR